jgi:hypothetical protein
MVYFLLCLDKKPQNIQNNGKLQTFIEKYKTSGKLLILTKEFEVHKTFVVDLKDLV